MISRPSALGAINDAARYYIYTLVGQGVPISGTTGTAPVGVAGVGCLYVDRDSGITYFNEATIASPYWTPVSYLNPLLLSWCSDFRDGLGKPVADVNLTYTLPGSGIRIFGEGIDETDSGFVVAIGEGGAIGTLITTDEADHAGALGVGITTSVPYQPDNNGSIVVDALVAQSADVLLRRFFLGWVGLTPDNITSPCTGSGTTITNVQDDLAGLFFDVGLTDGDRYFTPYNKGGTDPTRSTALINTGVDVANAGTYQRLRVEVTAAGVVRCFINKVEVKLITGALDVDEEIAPLLLLESTSAATKSCLVKQFACWGDRA